MRSQPVTVHSHSARDGVAAAQLREAIAAVEKELGVPDSFPADVVAEAGEAAQNPRLPGLDRTDIAFVTIDPPDAQDLDQAMYLERTDSGFTVYYAIADVAAFVTPEGAIDHEVRRRGETWYGPSRKVPLHPREISEAAGSLLPGQTCPAVLWTHSLDSRGERIGVTVERALVRSRGKYDYDGVQKFIDEGPTHDVFELLREVGELRIALEVERGAVSLPLPEQEIHVEDDRWHLEFRKQLPVEKWNAQISLLTGFAAAELMVTHKVGVLRTLPPAEQRDVDRLRRTARGLKIEWPAETDYPEFIRALDPEEPTHQAMVVASTRLLRGSGYAGFNGEVPEQSQHAALAAQYAHCTAPLRRLVDRYASEICLSLSAGQPVPQWVLSRLEELPDIMAESGRRAGAYERAFLRLAEAGTLAPRVGERFDGVVVDLFAKDERRGDITIDEPAIEAWVHSDEPLELGSEVRVVLETADIGGARVEFKVTR